jgi:hypothetical protein
MPIMVKDKLSIQPINLQFSRGKQRLETLDGYFIPISIQNGLPYIDMHPLTDEEL